MKLVLYFMIGAVIDVLATIDIKAVQHGKAGRSAIVTFINTVISYTVFYYIVTSPEYMTEIIAFALGGAIGAYFIIRGYNENNIKE